MGSGPEEKPVGGFTCSDENTDTLFDVVAPVGMLAFLRYWAVFKEWRCLSPYSSHSTKKTKC
jgi:hypothetical protein